MEVFRREIPQIWQEKIGFCLFRSVVRGDHDARRPNEHAPSLVLGLEGEPVRPVLQPLFLRPFRVEVIEKHSLVSNIVLLKPIPPPLKDNICNFFFNQNQERSQTGLFLTLKNLFCRRQDIFGGCRLTSHSPRAPQSRCC